MTKLSGSELRDSVASILRLTHPLVETEKRLVATTADVYFEEVSHQKFIRKFAVEAKDWSSPLSSKKIADIYNLYQPSIASGEIDSLWIIGKKELGMQPTDTINRMSNVAYSTYEEFVSSAMNFSLYLEDLRASFETTDASANFITSTVRGTGEKLEDAVEKWLNRHQKLMLIYGGYGLGKTTFSLYLASKLSKLYQNGEFARIPVRISLGGLFTKQDLRGLICSCLTGSEGSASVGNFSYNLFIHMVREGLVLLILDGFDEMRHAMDVDDFAYTFEQMSPLFEGKSKAIILGRPDSFFSDEEESRLIDSLLAPIFADASDVHKAEIDFMSEEQIEAYIEQFINTKTQSERLNTMRKIKENVISTEIEVLSRPVQLKMFTRVMHSYSDGKNKLTRYSLYNKFIDSFVKREDDKPARQVRISNFPSEQFPGPRVVFMQNLAWWVLMEKRENRFQPSEIPYNYIPTQFAPNRSRDGALREALVGSVIERSSSSHSEGTGLLGKKGGSYFYFPHKSYIEFLVVQYFLRFNFDKDLFSQFFRSMNKEMLSFLSEAGDEAVPLLRAGITFATGYVDREIIKICAKDTNINREISSLKSHNLTSDLIYTYYEYMINSDYDKSTISNFIFSCFVSAQNLSRVSSSVNLIRHFIDHFGETAIFRKMVVHVITSIGFEKMAVLARSDSVISVYNLDAASAKYIFFAKYFVCDGLNISCSTSNFASFSQKIAEGKLYVPGYDAEKSKNRRLTVTILDCEFGDPRYPVILQNCSAAERKLFLYGDAERLLG
ncbi:NACHT domain-containing protein [Rhizobium sp. SL42]|uniref:NACHT domain-containing protein n=1 Tax=Rhizobium sp. SL42 TaxID=2806346 RepID=UPI001F384C7A|nr:NACHT domain-containing protein [Rhizobium sp. SL42]UJW73786.1 NACHT domain-containing protein [Rhizobium sp. SL42]